MTAKEDNNVNKLAASLKSYNMDSDTFSDSDSSTYEDSRMSLVVRIDESIEVHANNKYDKKFIFLKQSPRVN